MSTQTTKDLEGLTGKRHYLLTEDDVIKLVLAKNLHIARLEDTIRALESLRPVWAMGFTDDGVAAQTTAAALASIWDVLKVDNQTQAMEKVKGLMQ